jgi:hypothetical protein
MPSLCKRPWIICASICLAVQIVINCSFADISFVTDIVAETYICSNVANCLKNIVAGSAKSLAIIERQLLGRSIVENSPGQIKDVGALGGMDRCN